MQIRKPDYINSLNLISLLLLPLSILTFAINIIKKFYKKKNFKIRTICVGNIYIGGTGKTPLCIKINKILKNKYKTVFIKKYYKEHKDEHRLLKSNGSLISMKSRDECLLKAEKRGFDFAILDDGLQDKIINYNKTIACFNSSVGIGNGFLIPSGPLRESLKSIKNYDAIFINGQGNDFNLVEKIRGIKKNIKIFRGSYEPLNLKQFNLKKNYLFFCGIGSPIEFEKTLKKYKFNIKDKMIFPDHYNYTSIDLKEIKKNATQNNLDIITTEKDYLRINIADRKKIKFLKIDLKVHNQKKFQNFLMK